MVLWAIRPSHTSQSHYSDPERIDSDRFSPARAEDNRHEHAFQKKSKSGIKTPTVDLEMIRRRLKAAEADYKVQLGKGKAS